MGRLIETLPVYKPQQPQKTVVKKTVVEPKQDINGVKNPFPQTEIYSYIPAKPISPGHTKPIGIKPTVTTARLVHENIFQSMWSTVKSYGDYAKYFYNAAFKGKGDDYSVGKINDLAIRAGSLGIAAVLSSSKMFPFAKGMEFVGLGTWFASMAVWPHILGAPVKALYNVDINQEYIDTYKRRKFVYEDNQYRPMDIFRHVDVNGKPLSDKEYYSKYEHDYAYLDKVGDDLGIPRGIKNRTEATMNKMCQVATQARTLSMLTAGFMTPVISSIVADALQNPLKNHLEKTRYEKASTNLKNLDSQIDTLLNGSDKSLKKVMDTLGIVVDKKTSETFNKLLTSKEALSKEEFNELTKFIDKKIFGTGYYDTVREAMLKSTDMTEPKILVNNEFKESITRLTKDAVKEVLKKFPEDKKAKLPEAILNYSGLSPQQMNELLEETFNTGSEQLRMKNYESLKQSVARKVFESFQNVSSNDKNNYRNFQRAVLDKINDKTEKYIDSKRYHVVLKDEISKIFNFAVTNNQLQERIKEFEATSIQNISESMTAISWERVPKTYIKALGFTDAEIAILATQDPTTASKTLGKKLSEIAQDTERFKTVVSEMSNYAKTAISKEEKAILKLIGTNENPGTFIKLKMLMEQVAEHNFNSDVKNVLATHYNSRLNQVVRKIRNTTDSYVRPIKAMDLIKNIKAEVKSILGSDAEAYNNLIKSDIESHLNKYYPFHKMSYERAFKALENYLTDAILQKNDINNWTTKWETELPTAKRGMKHSLELVTKMADKMFGALSGDTVSAINDAEFVYKCNFDNSVMRSRFLRIENELSKTYTTVYAPLKDQVEAFFNGNKDIIKFIKDALEEARFTMSSKEYKDCRKVIQNVIDGVHNSSNYNKQEALDFLSNKLSFKCSNCEISEVTGKNVTEFFINAAQEIRSRNKWSKLVYGILGGTLAVSAVTIALMGKRNYFNKDKYEYIATQQGADK